MAKQYIFRLDDISWDMNYENFSRIRDLFFRYDIRPLIGVIPKNEDPALKAQVGKRHLSEEEFWKEILCLQKEHGWAVALHGYDHVYVTGDGGMFRINPFAEFAGLPYKQQEEKIRLGKTILEEHGIVVEAFMAPGHSLDWNTVEALKQNGIFAVTDGLTAYPKWKKDVLFIPQVWSWPRNGICGIDTVCFHINSWKDGMFKQLEEFLQENYKKCITWADAVKQAPKSNSLWKRFINRITHFLILIEKRVRRIKSQLVH